MLVHSCRRCGFETRIFQDYLDHLLEVRHQSAARATFLKWSDDENLKSIVVYTPTNVPPPTPSDLMGIFRKHQGMVCDFVYWPDAPRLFLVQFPNKSNADSVLAVAGKKKGKWLKIGGENVQVRRKPEVLQNEWGSLIGDGGMQQGSSRDPVLISLSDDSGKDDDDDGNELEIVPVPQSSSNVSTGEADGVTVSVINDDATDSDESTSQGKDYSDYEVKILTKISQNFIDAFLAKVKQDKVDDKRKVKENLKLMEQTWTQIYVDFHNRIWPVGLVMANSGLKPSHEKGVGFQAKFDCECRRSESNEWFRAKYNRKERENIARVKIEQFRDIFQNLSECNLRLMLLESLKKSNKDKPIFNFHCEFVVTSNSAHQVKAELTISKIQGKHLNSKLYLIRSIFNEAFREYEKSRVMNWKAKTVEPELNSCAEWKMIKID